MSPGRFALAVAAIALGSSVQAADNVTYVEQLNCTNGPYRIKLPKSYKAVRTLAPIKKEEILRTEDWDTYKAQYRSLSFEGLELAVVTFSNDPDRYLLSSATLSGPAWKMAGRLKVGNSAKFALRGFPVKAIPSDGKISFGGDSDSIHITLSGGRVTEVDYDCYTG